MKVRVYSRSLHRKTPGCRIRIPALNRYFCVSCVYRKMNKPLIESDLVLTSTFEGQTPLSIPGFRRFPFYRRGFIALKIVDGLLQLRNNKPCFGKT